MSYSPLFFFDDDTAAVRSLPDDVYTYGLAWANFLPATTRHQPGGNYYQASGLREFCYIDF